jgi:hypothetical protein
MTMMRDGSHGRTTDVFEVGSTLTKIHSFTFSPSTRHTAEIRSFSPTTYRISVSIDNTLYIFSLRNPRHLLAKTGNFLSHCFSSDGDYFAASQESGIHVWEYHSGSYKPWREVRCQGWSNSPLRFPSTPSSILGHSGDILQVLRLHGLPTAPKIDRQQYVGLSRSGTHIATAYKWESTITIIDLLGQTPSQFIDTGMVIQEVVITGNVLLVTSPSDFAAWLLTEEGLVDGVIGDRRVNRNDSIWKAALSRVRGDRESRTFPVEGSWAFSVEGQVGVIGVDGKVQHVYHTETGEVLHPTQAAQHFGGRWYHFDETLCGRDNPCYHNLSHCNTPPEDSWQTSRATLREGWVKDPEGKHRLWVPFEWRMDWDPADWRQDVTTQFSYLGDGPVLIKF